MKKQVRILLFAVLTVLMLTLAIVGVSAAGEFVAKNSSGTQIGAYDTLADAVANVTSGGTVEVQSSISVSATQTLSNSTTYTITGKTGSEVITFTGSAYMNFTAGTVTLQSINVTAAGSQAILISGSTATKVTVVSGRYCCTNAAGYALKTTSSSSSSTLTIQGGYFTFLDNKFESDINFSNSTTYANSLGIKNNRGIGLMTNGTVVISGGTFMCGDSYQSVMIDSGYATKLNITGGNFYGYRALSQYSAKATAVVYGGNFYGNPGQANNKLIDLREKGARIDIYGGVFENKAASSGAIIFAEASGVKINIHGGEFTCASTNAGSAIIKLHTADNTLSIDKTTKSYGGKTYGSTPVFTKSGNGAAISTAASNNTVTISAGTFTATGLTGSLLYFNATASTVQIKGGSYNVDGVAQVLSHLAGNVTISTGTFNSTGTDILVVAAHEGSLTITGGTFNLKESTLSGTILRTTVLITNQVDLYQYYDPTTLYSGSSAPITISGGRFNDNRAGNNKTIDTTIGSSFLNITNILITCNAQQKYFIDVAQGHGQDVPMTAADQSYYQGGALYYVYVYSAATANAPVMQAGAAVDLNPGNYNGIRFLSYIPVSVVETLGLTLDSEFGTLIAPADYVARAGGFTHAKLDALYNNASYNLDRDNPVYVDIQAIDTKTVDTEGNIHFSGALVRIKEGNNARNFAAVAYIKLADGTYYYSTYDAEANSRSMQEVAMEALTDYDVFGADDGAYFYDSIYKPGFKSRYDDEIEQPLLQQYSGYYHSLTNQTVTLDVGVGIYGSDYYHCSKNLQTAITNIRLATSQRGNAPLIMGIIGDTYAMTDEPYDQPAINSDAYKAIMDSVREEIGGDGYYIGVKCVYNGKVVDYLDMAAMSDDELANVSRYVLAVGTSNPLALQAAQVFEQSFFKEGSVSIDERVHKSTEVITLNSDIPIVFAYTRDGNFKLPITNPSIASDYNVAFSISGYNHLYNKELNGYVGGQEGKLVDYPIVAGIEIGAALTACGNAANFTDGYVYSFIPDNFEVGSFHIEVGLTKYARTRVLAGQEIGYYGYAIKDGKITITAFDDPTLRLAKQLFIDNLADFLVDGVYQIPTDLEYACYKSEGLTGAVNALYAYETAQGSNHDASTQLDKFSFVVNNLPRPDGINLSGAVDVGDNTLQLYYNDGVGLSNYNEYRDKLVNDNGFKVYMDERKVEGSRYVTLTKVIGSDTITVHLIYDAYAHADDEAVSDANTANKLDLMFTPTLRVIAAKVDNNLVNLLPTKYHKLQTYTKKTDTRITNVQISSDSFGYCYIYTLEDGSFIVLDGGGGGERQGLVSKNSINAGLIYNTLVNLHTELFGAPSTSNKIKIAAWYLSHGHGDHYGTMDTFMSEYVSGSNKKVEVEAIIHNFPSNDEIYNAFDPNPTVRNNYINGSPYKNGSTAIPYYKVHTGQKFFIRNMEFEVLYTHEDIHPWAVEFYNNTSTVIRLTAHYTNGDGKPVAGSQAVSNMILGDLQVRGSQVMRARYGDYLKSDMVQLSHHGGNGVEAELYYNIDAQVIWWTHSADNMKTNTDAYSASAYVKENVAMLNNTRWLYIFTLNPLSKNMTENEYKNLTVKMTKDGFPGLYSRLEEDTSVTLAQKQGAGMEALFKALRNYEFTATPKKSWGTINDFTWTSEGTSSEDAHNLCFSEIVYEITSAERGTFLVKWDQTAKAFHLVRWDSTSSKYVYITWNETSGKFVDSATAVVYIIDAETDTDKDVDVVKVKTLTTKGFIYTRQDYSSYTLPITYPKDNKPAMSGDDVNDPFTNFEIPEIIW